MVRKESGKKGKKGTMKKGEKTKKTSGKPDVLASADGGT